tara:strand:- start:40 stop:864 length:825 start_codon:yes stop_codon:yes gene_type:complete
MASQGGVRVQLLSNKQLATMVGSIITAAQNFKDGAKGQVNGAGLVADSAALKSLLQKQQAAVRSEESATLFMDGFVGALNKQTKWQKELTKKLADAMSAKLAQIIAEGLSSVSVWLQGTAAGIIGDALDIVTPGTSRTDASSYLRREGGGMDDYQEKSGYKYGFRQELGLDQQENTQWLEQFSSNLSTLTSSVTGLTDTDLKDFDKGDAQILMSKLLEATEKLSDSIILGQDKIQSDHGSRKEDELISDGVLDMVDLMTSLKTLTGQLNNIITQ